MDEIIMTESCNNCGSAGPWGDVGRDATGFASQVLEAARRVEGSGRYANCAFVAAVWAAMPGALTLEDFKNRLILENQRNTLALSQADLPYCAGPELQQAGDPEIVRESAIPYMGVALFNLIALEPPR